MKESVLYYVPAPAPHSARLKSVLVQMGVRIRNVRPEQVTQKVGYLAGMPGFEEEEAAAPLPEITEEMLVMNHFSSRRVDELLSRLHRAGVPKIALKAVLTETNCGWTFDHLYQEIRKEHEQMSRDASAES